MCVRARAISLRVFLDSGDADCRFIASFWQGHKEEKEQTVKKPKPVKSALLAPAAANNARNAAQRARDEMEVANAKLREAKAAAQAARDIPPLWRKKSVMDTNEVSNKPPSILKLRLSQGRNFPLVGDTVFSRETNVYAKLLVRDPKIEGVAPVTFYSTTRYKQADPEFLQDFEFPIAADWDDEERPETIEIIFLHEATSFTGKSGSGKQDPEHDHEFGRYTIQLMEFAKLQPKRRQPDGAETPAHFAGTITKWFKLHDADNEPVRGPLPGAHMLLPPLSLSPFPLSLPPSLCLRACLERLLANRLTHHD